MENSKSSEQSINKYIATYLSFYKSFTLLAFIFISLWLSYISFSDSLYKLESLIQISENDSIKGVEDILSSNNKVNLEEQIAIYTSRANIRKLTEELFLNVYVDDIQYLKNNNIKLSELNYSFESQVGSKNIIITKINDSSYSIKNKSDDSSIQNALFKNQIEFDGLTLNVAEINTINPIYVEIVNPTFYDEKLIKSFSFNEVIESRFMSTGKSLLRISFISNDIEIGKSVLNTANNIFLKNNAEVKKESANTAVTFLSDQIKLVGLELEKSQKKLNNFLELNDTFDINNQTEFLANQFSEINRQIQDIDIKLAEVSSEYQETSPIAIKLNAQKQVLISNLDEINTRISILPQKQQDYLSLLRGVDINRLLYETLISVNLEYSVLQASTISDVRIIDNAFYVDKVQPKEFNSLVVFFVLGLLTSILYVFMFELFFKKVNGLQDIFEIFPSSTILGNLPSVTNNLDPNISFANNSKEFYSRIEAAAVNFDMKLKENPTKNVFLITSSTQEAGKSTFGYEFSNFFADVYDKKVCILDLDYKRGDLHRKFKTKKMPSTTNFNNINFEEHKISKNLTFIPRIAGQSENFIRLVNDTSSFKNTLTKLRNDFDVVFIDSTPMLGSSDALAIIQYIDAIFFVVKEGTTPMRDLQNSINILKDISNIEPYIIYNFYKSKSSLYRYKYSYNYVYKYSYLSDEDEQT